MFKEIRPGFWLVIAGMALVAGCKKANNGDVIVTFKQQKGEPMAHVGATTLTVEEMRTDFQERQGTFKGAPNLNTEKARDDYMENQVMQEAMFQKAIALGYFDRADVKRDVKKIVVQKFVRDKLEAAQAQFVPTEQQLQEHYDKNQNFYNRAESVKVAFISIPFGANKDKAKEIATAIHKDAVATVKNSNTREFARLAMKHAPTIKSGTQISLETNETDYLDQAAFEAKFGPGSFEPVKNVKDMGEFTPLLTTENAYVILMKTGFRKPLNETLAEAKPKITKRLAYESRNDYYKKLMEELRAEFNIKVNKELYAKLSEGLPNAKVADSAPKPVEQKPASPQDPEPAH